MKREKVKIVRDPLKHPYRVILYTAILLLCFGCKYSNKEKVSKRKDISNLTVYGNHLYFGAGYKLYCIDLSTKSLETLYTTNSIRVEQPVVTDDIVYFGGRGFYNEHGAYGDRDCFFAFNIKSKKILWKYRFVSDGYGTFGTFPVLVGESVLVCARKYLCCLDQKRGEILWRIDNWFGKDSGLPYVHKDYVYYKLSAIGEDDSCDGSWAIASITDSKRVDEIPLPKSTHCQGLGTMDNGVVYLTTRHDYVGAIDLINKRLLWEVGSNFSQSQPAVNDNYVFASTWISVIALDKKTGEVVWEKAVKEIIDDTKPDKEVPFSPRGDIRVAATDTMVFVRADKGIIAFNAKNGELIWSKYHEPDFNTTYPIVVDGAIIIANYADSCLIALDLETGAELWKVKIPDCSVYMLPDYD